MTVYAILSHTYWIPKVDDGNEWCLSTDEFHYGGVRSSFSQEFGNTLCGIVHRGFISEFKQHCREDALAKAPFHIQEFGLQQSSHAESFQSGGHYAEDHGIY